MPRRHALAALAVALVLGWHALSSGQPPTRDAVLQLGRAATALLEVEPGPARAAAFCVHPSGLFVTTERLARQAGEGKGASLILDPGSRTQRVRKAVVVRGDRGADLALLRVEGETGLPFLPLGRADALAEVKEVTAFGFPSGTPPAPGMGEYSPPSAAAAKVMHLHHRDGQARLFHLDAVSSPGQGGGPVLDQAGRVVGVLTAGVKGSEISFAVPVNRLAGFLTAPDLRFTPPTIYRGLLSRPLTFEARAESVLPFQAPPELELVLRGADGQERKHKMTRAGDVFRATAVPSPRAAEARLRATLRFANASVSGTVADRTITVAGTQKFSLSTVRMIRFQPQPHVELHGGYQPPGPVAGWDAVELFLDDKTPLRLPLTGATELRLEAPQDDAAVEYALVVTRDGKEMARQTGRLGEPAPLPQGKPAGVGEPGPRAKTSCKLPAPIQAVCVGGGGRFLILHLARLRKLAIFDVVETRVVHYLPLEADDFMVVAGLDRLLVLLPGSNTVERYSLTTFTREASAPWPFKGTVKAICMGGASRGPLLAAGVDGPPLRGVAFLDCDTLKPLELTTPHDLTGDGPVTVRAAMNGEVFTHWRHHNKRSTLRLQGKELKVHSQESFENPLPGPDGERLYGSELLTWEFRPAPGSSRERPLHPFLPAHQGPYYLAPQASFGSFHVHLHLAGEARPLARLENARTSTPGAGPDPSTLPLEVRFHLVPSAKILVVLPSDQETLELYPFDPDAALEESDIDLIVKNPPPLSAARGGVYSYPMNVQARYAPLTYKVETGPKGMTVTDDGVLTWKVPPDYGEEQAQVLVGVRDRAGQELFHTFTIKLLE